MSTRSVVARQAGDDWQGRYVHSDGYPTAMIQDLLALVEQDGVDKVAETVVDAHEGWSYLRPGQPDFSRVRVRRGANWQDYPNGSPQQQKVLFNQSYSHDKRFVNVPSYGVAYTAKQDCDPEPYSRDSDPDAGWTYVLTAKAVLAFYRIYGTSWDTWTWLQVGRFPYGEVPSDEVLRVTECGADFERCGHCAYVHFPEAKDIRVGVDVWLGRRQPGIHDLATVCVRGRWLTLTGSGGTGTATDSRYNPISPQRYWWAGVRRADGSSGKDIRLGRMLKGGCQLDHDATAPTADGPVLLHKGGVIDA